ncbi:MAG: ATP-binding cassette domain-containing protein [Treponema sp.]|nr:ATP-binding cassette domain-containing protein [Treponema sp.]
MNKPVITVTNLTKRYKNAALPAVDNISFSVGEGEFFAFLGQNGAGKTTTISILTTTLAKTSGSVNIAGYDLDRESRQVRNHILIQKGTIVFQGAPAELKKSFQSESLEDAYVGLLAEGGRQ